MASARHAFLLRALFIVAATFWVFSPSVHGDWIMDDFFYLPQNALLHDPHRLWKIWFAPGSLIEYYPIEATLQAVQWHWWHLNTLGYHLTNIVLHSASALLVWRLLAKFHLRYAWLGGLLFAIHPTAVESVAWISEFKNTLSLPPFLLATIFWIDFEQDSRARDYGLALGWFALAMLCKISMAGFPFVILLYAWWRRGRLGRSDFIRAAPFFAVSLVLGLGSINAGASFFHRQLQTQGNPDIGGPATHLALAGQSLAYYFAKSILPVDIVPISPYHWAIHPASPFAYTPWLVFAAVLAVCWSRRASWGRHVLLGLGFFFINLLPFLGFNAVTYMAYTWVMDHFLYLPLLGVIGLAIAALGDLESRLGAKAEAPLAGVIAVVFAFLALESDYVAAQFVGPEALWSYILAHNPESWLAHNNLGNVRLTAASMETDAARKQRLMEQAIAEYQAALAINPASLDAHTNLGFTYEILQRPDEAMEQYQDVVRINPHYPVTQYHLAHLLEITGHIPEAIEHYRQSLQINPQDSLSREALRRLQPTGKD